MEQAVDTAAATSEAACLAASYDAADADGIRDDAVLQRLLGQIDVADLVALVDGLKAAEGDGRSIALYRGWLVQSLHKTTQVFAAWYNLGVQLSAAGQTAEAAAAFRSALAARPDLNAAAVNAGLCHETMHDPEGALQIWQKALQPDEDRVTLLNHRGRLLEQLKRYDEAESSLRASLLTDPRQPDAIHHWTGIRAKTCTWPVFDSLPGLTKSELLDAAGGLSRLALSDDIAFNDRANAAWMERKFPPSQSRLSPETGYAHRKLRIGYMSSDFCMHPMAYLVADLFEEHDRDAFTIYGYCSTKDDGSEVRRRVLASFDHLTPILGMTDEEVARKIRADEIDILVELNGLTLGTRLPVLRWRPAPVQVTYLGYNGPIPFDELDYIIADRYVIPPEIAETHRPKPLYLPRCFQANDRKLPVGRRGTRAEVGLPDGAFVFCCFSNNYKITEEVFAAWTTILRRTENTVLWLYADNEPARRNMEMRFRAQGLDPDRLRFAARTSPEQYRSRLALADLFLDTFPYNAGTTASDALRVGLPIVTLSGRSFVSRMAGSLLEAIGLQDGITDSLDAYIDLAAALATDPERYRAFRAELDRNAWARSLGDTPAFTRAFEATLRSVAILPMAVAA